ncbi:perlucin-like protein [Mercenaria mercenaria]|uniref:perlucin-like protein n=1 Tax=Mercenaria mercenaria TaxID=6596 RepID=UPI00234F7F09|nr:perlucin-like protein [Mercenaria mercenaria]
MALCLLWIALMAGSGSKTLVTSYPSRTRILRRVLLSSFLPGNVKGFFTAYTDVDTEGTWVAYGTINETTFTDWEDNEPNGNVGENCMALWIASNLQWVDVDCNDGQNRIICEKET